MADISFCVLWKTLCVGEEVFAVFLLCFSGERKTAHLTAKVQQSLSWEMRRIFFAIMEKRLWNKNSVNKIRNNFKGETCSPQECLYGTFTAEQGKTQ